MMLSGGQQHRHINILYTMVTLRPLLWGNTTYCVKLNGEDVSPRLNKTESAGIRKCLHYH